MFVRENSRGEGAQIAQVYILSAKQFNLKALPESIRPYSNRHKVEVRRPTPRYAYVIVYTGDLNELLVPKKDRQPG